MKKSLFNYKQRLFVSKDFRGARRASALLILLVASTLILIQSIFYARAFNSSTATTAKPSEVARAKLGDRVSVRAAGRGNPFINLGNGRDVLASYQAASGYAATNAEQLLASDNLVPLALASGDFDEDGIADLISGYAKGNSGIITIHRGNVDSIYPDSPEARQRKAEGTSTDAPFLSPAIVFEVDQTPDFIKAGDFDADGHWDLAMAARESNTVYFLSGDGRASLGAGQAVVLPGRVTALEAGEVNRADGLADLVVGIEEADGPKLLIFEGPDGAMRSEPETLPLPAEAKAITIGYLSPDHSADVAVAAERELVIVLGRDRKLSLDDKSRAEVPEAAVSKQEFTSALTSLAVGDFAGDGGLELAVASEDGTVQLIRGKETKAGKGRVEWVAETILAETGSSDARLVSTRVSSLSKDTLLVMDRAEHRMQVWMNEAERRERGELAGASSPADRSAAMIMDVEGEPVAALPMRLNIDALSDLVILRQGHSAPSIVETRVAQTFCVTNTSDCSGNGCGSLRAALSQANSNPGVDTIAFDRSFSGTPTIRISSPLPTINEAVVITGNGLCGNQGPNDSDDEVSPQAATRFQVQGNGGVSHAVRLSTGGSRVVAFVINNVGDGVQVQSRGNIVENNFLGTDINGNTTVGGNGGRGVFVNNSAANLIGGTAAQARNIITGNNTGIEINGGGATDNTVLNNFIGFNAAGNSVPGNNQNGVTISGNASRNTIGGAPSVVGQLLNAIAGNLDGVAVTSGVANLIQSNQIDSNRRNGVALNSSGNTIGGTSASFINGIWQNGTNGVEINGVSASDNLVQRNFIGVNFGPNNTIFDRGNTQHGVLIQNSAPRNVIGGGSEAAGNTILLNRADGVSIIAGTQNSILSNRIFANGDLGIDLGNNGPTANDDRDIDTGPNDFQNFPVITSVSFSPTAASSVVTPAATLSVAVNFNSTPNQTFTLEFFANSNCECRGVQCITVLPILIGIRPATTDANGNFSTTFTFDFTPPATGGFINAKATASNGNTSEFSQCIQVGTNTGCSIACPTNQTVISASPVVVNFPQPTLAGACAGVNINCVPARGATFPVGTTTVNCTAADQTGTRATCNFTVTVAPPAGPVITSVTKSGKKLFVDGTGFDNGADIYLNGEKQKTANDEASPTTRLISKKAGKKVKSNDIITVKNDNGAESAGFPFP